jgi:hypothetical protein
MTMGCDERARHIFGKLSDISFFDMLITDYTSSKLTQLG